MANRQPPTGGHAQRRGFLDGPAVAALFHALRRAGPLPETPPRIFVAAQDLGHATGMKM